MLDATDLFHCLKTSLILLKIEDFLGVTSCWLENDYQYFGEA